jgi:hypothetical protein
MQRYKYSCEVVGAEIADLNQWLANHTIGRHRTSQQYKPHPQHRGGQVKDCVVVSLDNDGD